MRFRTPFLFPFLALAAQAQMPGAGGRDMAWEQQRMMQQLQSLQRQVQMQQNMMRMQQQQMQMQQQQAMQLEAARRNRLETQVARQAEQLDLAAPLQKPSQVLWKLPTDTKDQLPSTDGSRVLVTLHDRTIRCVDAENGKQVWEATETEDLALPPMFLEGLALYATQDYRLVLRDPATGKVLQDIKMDGLSRFRFSGRKEHPTVMLPALEGGKLLVATYGKNEAGSADGRLHAYDPASGKQLWECPLPGGPDLPPVVSGDKVIIGGAAQVLALNLGDGKRAWYLNTGARFIKDLGGALLLGGRYCFFNGSTLYALDAATGSKVWSQDIDDAIPLLLGEGERLLVRQAKTTFGRRRDWVQVLDAATGAKVWERKLGSTQMPWVQVGLVYCTADEQAMALDLATGKPVWSVKLPDDPEVPLFPMGGAALTVSHSRKTSTVHALDAKTGQALWTFSFEAEVGSGFLTPTGKGLLFPGEKGEVIALR